MHHTSCQVSTSAMVGFSLPSTAYQYGYPYWNLGSDGLWHWCVLLLECDFQFVSIDASSILVCCFNPLVSNVDGLIISDFVRRFS